MTEPTPPTDRTVITARRTGSILVQGGDWLLLDADGNPMPLPERKDPTRISLCGCGHSAIWPICDATHKTKGRDCVVPAPEEGK